MSAKRYFLQVPNYLVEIKLILDSVFENVQRLVKKTFDKFKRNSNAEFSKRWGFLGESPSMQSVYQLIDSAAQSKATVFITGESGTGKEVCAEAIHAASPRKNGPFIAINCAAIPKDLIESELFGHVKGAFTGALFDRQGAVEYAHGGTLFLDEICEMDLNLQTKLLRFIQTSHFNKVGGSQTSEVDVRFVCATNRDPWQAVLRGSFREDLYYRLHVIPVALPPLRARGADILLMAQFFLLQYATEEGKSFQTFSEKVQNYLLGHFWPGNVRQLQNVIRNIVVLHTGETVTMEMLPASFLTTVNLINQEDNVGSVSQNDGLPLNLAHNCAKEEIAPSKGNIEPLRLVEKRAILTALDLCNGNIPQAAGLLEISPSTLYRKLQFWQQK